MALRMAGHQQVDFRLTTAAGRQQLLHLQAVSLCPCHAATILCVNMDCPSVPVSGLPCQYTRAAMPPGQLVPKALLSQCASHNKVQHAPPLTTLALVPGLSAPVASPPLLAGAGAQHGGCVSHLMRLPRRCPAMHPCKHALQQQQQQQ
jgi:hypothetical protein